MGQPTSTSKQELTPGAESVASLVIAPIKEIATPWCDSPRACGQEMQNVRRITNGAIAVSGQKIISCGAEAEVFSSVKRDSSTVVLDARDKLVIPGFIDAHTHTVFGGNRANEFIMRCQGKTYAEIAEAGGGIVASMRATQNATIDELIALARPRLSRMLEHGTTSVEIKTGYGLSTESELNMLTAICLLSKEQKLDIVPTFMPAHAVPPGGSKEAYVQEVIDVMLPRAWEICRKHDVGWAFVDVFCDRGYFTLDDTKRIFDAARTIGFRLKVHSDEFQNLGATKLATAYKATSADHLLNISDEEIELLSRSETAAVLLPGTSFYLNLDEHAPARKMIDTGVSVALGTDFNPGSCHIFSMPMIFSLACLHLKMTPEEALTALTLNGAYAAGYGGDRGMVRPGYKADITICSVSSLEEIPYNVGWNPISRVIKGGALMVADKESS